MSDEACCPDLLQDFSDSDEHGISEKIHSCRSQSDALSLEVCCPDLLQDFSDSDGPGISEKIHSCGSQSDASSLEDEPSLSDMEKELETRERKIQSIHKEMSKMRKFNERKLNELRSLYDNMLIAYQQLMTEAEETGKELELSVAENDRYRSVAKRVTKQIGEVTDGECCVDEDPFSLNVCCPDLLQDFSDSDDDGISEKIHCCGSQSDALSLEVCADKLTHQLLVAKRSAEEMAERLAQTADRLAESERRNGDAKERVNDRLERLREDGGEDGCGGGVVRTDADWQTAVDGRSAELDESVRAVDGLLADLDRRAKAIGLAERLAAVQLDGLRARLAELHEAARAVGLPPPPDRRSGHDGQDEERLLLCSSQLDRGDDDSKTSSMDSCVIM